MATVAVTGVSGYIGRVLTAALDAEGDVARVIGIDTSEPAFSARKLEFYEMDVRSNGLGEVLSGCDVVVHLASRDAGDPDEMLAVSVDGTRNVVEAAAAAGVRRFVHLSSGAVYGAHADNAVPLDEDAALRPNTDYGKAKAAGEEVVRTFAQNHPEIVVTVLRPAWTLGPRLPGAKAQFVESPLNLAVEGHAPVFQAVHEDDVAAATTFAVRNDLPGVFNVSADDWTDRRAELLGQRTITVGAEALGRILDGAKQLGVPSATAIELPMLMHPVVTSNARLREAGFAFEHSTADALEGAEVAHRGWVNVGGVRFRPRWLVAAAGFGFFALRSAVRRLGPSD